MVKINQFEVENVKRVKAVAYDCTGETLTVIGGNNAQGKTSVLDAIMWTLGGDRYKPGNAMREGAEKLATKVTLSNGIIVERRGQGSLKITSPDGRSGQELLNEFVNQFALDLPKFMNASQTDKAHMLLDLFPDLGQQLNDMNEEVKRMFDERHALGVIATRKAKHAEDLPYIEGLPEEPLSGREMTDKLQKALAINARNAETRRRAGQVAKQIAQAESEVASQKQRIAELEARLNEERERLNEKTATVAGLKLEEREAKASIVDLQDEDTTALEQEMEAIDATNAKIRSNLDKRKAEAEATDLQGQYREITEKLDELRAQRLKLLSSVDMPMDGLAIGEAGELLFNGQPWDCMSGSEQLRVAVAISAAVKPECGFVLLDSMERMDVKQLRQFAAWLEAKGLQAIGTRVSTGDECSLVIEDGHQVGERAPAKPIAKATARKPLPETLSFD
jgi:hypothetical protein